MPSTTQSYSIGSITSALGAAQSAFDKYAGKKGALTVPEASELLNSPELKKAMVTLANVEPPYRSEADIRAAFKAADSDNNGTLSKTEFLALYTSLIKDRVKASPLVLAEALLGLIDVDRNGRIEGGELKVVLAMLGFPAALLLPIPKFIGIDYRSILKSFEGKGDK